MNGVDFSFLDCRENRLEHADFYGAHYEHVKEEDPMWLDSFKTFITKRCFFGHMYLWELQAQQACMPENTYFTCISDVNVGWFELCAKNECGMKFRVNCENWERVKERVAFRRGCRELDRGDGLIFRKASKALALTAIMCWSMVGRRLGVVKDMRVMIAKMVWEESRVWVL